MCSDALQGTVRWLDPFGLHLNAAVHAAWFDWIASSLVIVISYKLHTCVCVSQTEISKTKTLIFLFMLHLLQQKLWQVNYYFCCIKSFYIVGLCYSSFVDWPGFVLSVPHKTDIKFDSTVTVLIMAQKFHILMKNIINCLSTCNHISCHVIGELMAW